MTFQGVDGNRADRIAVSACVVQGVFRVLSWRIPMRLPYEITVSIFS